MRTTIFLLAAAIATPAVAQDHSGMDHGQMDHSTMDHSMMDEPEPEMDHSTMDHAQMDHSQMDMEPDASMDGMDHSMHEGHGIDTGPQVEDQPGNAPPPPVPTDHAADAIFGPDVMRGSRAELFGGMQFTGFYAGLETLEYRMGDGPDGYSFEGMAMYGGDIDRGVLAYQGEGTFGESPEAIEIDAYWRHAINPWFNLQLGARHDFRPDPERTYAMVGIDGLAPYWVEVEAQAFVSEKGDFHLRGSAAHDMRLTQHLVLEPEAEIDVALQDVPELGIGSGVEKIELSARLRYEIRRNIAPYVGFAWERKLGGTADFAREENEDPSRFTWLAGLRFWF